MFAFKKKQRSACGMHICSREIRLAYFQARTGEAPQVIVDVAQLPPGDRNLKQLDAALETLVRKHSLRQVPLAITLDGDFCVTRVTTGTATEVDRELEQLHGRIPRYLSLGPGEKITGGLRISLNQRNEYAVTGIANRRVIETIRRALQRFSLQANCIEPAMVAVSRFLSPEKTGDLPYLLADGSGSQWEVGIASAGRLLLDYRPSGTRQADRFVSILLGHMARLNRFCERHRQMSQSQLDVLYLFGPSAKVETVKESCAVETQLEARLLRPQELTELRLPEEVQADPGWVGAIAALATAQGLERGMVTANLLASLRSIRIQTLRYQVVTTLVPLALAATLMLIARGSISNQRAGIARLEAWQDAHRDELKEIRATLAKSTELSERIGSLEAIESQVQEQMIGIRLVEQIPQVLPDAARLSRYQYSINDDVHLYGRSKNEAVIFDLTQAIRTIPEVTDVSLQGTTPTDEAESEEVDFDIAVQLTNAKNAKVAP